MGKPVKRSKRKFMGKQFVSRSTDVNEATKVQRKRRGRPLKASFSARSREISQDGPRPGTSRTRMNEASDHENIPQAQSTPKPTDQKSMSSRKIQRTRELFSTVEQYSNAAMDDICDEGYRFIDINVLSKVFSMLPCPDCLSHSLVFGDILKKKIGFASFLLLSCKSCAWSHEFCTSDVKQGGFEVKKRVVYAMRNIGQGYSGAKKFCSVMNMPNLPTKNNYLKLSKVLKSAAFNVATESMDRASQEVKSCFNTGITECAVSVDGCWQKRGYVSMSGCVAVISIDTGCVLDVEPMSRFCKECQVHDKLDIASVEYKQWKAEHSNCKADFKGSAPAMEPEGANRIFKRSVEKYGLHYTKYFGDGDSNSFQRVQDTYKDIGKKVEKYECIGHVQKRVGAALRKLRKNKKEVRGKGRLTDKMIERLQNYYGIAIRSNVNNLEAMKEAILAALFHCASSSENEYHNCCPDGRDSWCGFKADKAKGTSKFKPGAGLPLKVIAEVKPIFARLSDEHLLQKCLHGLTQSQNESFNRMIWDRVPKSTFVGKDIFEFGIYDAVANFNMGAEAVKDILKKLGIEPGCFTSDHCHDLDNSRIFYAEYKCKDSSKTARKKLRSKRKAKDDKNKETEGENYAPGQF